ncbi:MAG: hypothetical protein GXP47_10800 [Acidobacteria bacterium]|nr:hypothetical protein [Acidobacteriota bacterium]
MDGRLDEGGMEPIRLIGEPSPEELCTRVFSVGRRLLHRFDVPMTETPSGVPATLLPAGGFRLLVLGIPVPVFAYMGDDNQELQRRIVTILRSSGGAALSGGRRVVLQSFSKCFGAAPEEEILALLPSFRSLNGRRKAVYLGVQLVTLLPLSDMDASLWPGGPQEIRECVDRFEQMVPALYGTLDHDLAQVHQSRVGGGDEPRTWAVDLAE